VVGAGNIDTNISFVLEPTNLRRVKISNAFPNFGIAIGGKIQITFDNVKNPVRILG
jgi:hypothetical protein